MQVKDIISQSEALKADLDLKQAAATAAHAAVAPADQAVADAAAALAANDATLAAALSKIGAVLHTAADGTVSVYESDNTATGYHVVTPKPETTDVPA